MGSLFEGNPFEKGGKIMIEWIVGGILLLGAVGKKLAESDNSGASHIGNGLEKLSDGTKNKICEMG